MLHQVCDFLGTILGNEARDFFLPLGMSHLSTTSGTSIHTGSKTVHTMRLGLLFRTSKATNQALCNDETTGAIEFEPPLTRAEPTDDPFDQHPTINSASVYIDSDTDNRKIL